MTVVLLLLTLATAASIGMVADRWRMQARSRPLAVPLVIVPAFRPVNDWSAMMAGQQFGPDQAGIATGEFDSSELYDLLDAEDFKLRLVVAGQEVLV